MSNNVKSNHGYCVICRKETVFTEYNEWLRDYYLCDCCKSIPRQRALVNALNIFRPDWRREYIHESSPCGPSSDYIKNNCDNYTESQFFKNVNYGEYLYGVRCENLECMTFDSESFDIFITQDVFEHVLNPSLAFREIARVLKPGGMHIFTMPWYTNLTKTIQRAKQIEDSIEFIEPPIYHGNPIDSSGSLVTYDWGLDFCDYIYKYSDMYTTIYLHKDRNLGLDAEFLHVFISRKI